MRKTRKLQATVAAIAIWFLGSTGAMAVAAQPDAAQGATERVITLGKVTQNPDRVRRTLGPIAAYVALKLQDFGVTGIRLLFAESNEKMAAHLRAGRVDWITESAASASAFVDNAGAEVLLRRWRRGAGEYQTIIIARRDSNILSLADLAGRTIAFESPGSTSTYFVPAHAMLQAGLTLTPLESPEISVARDSVGYVFSRDELVTSAWVHTGKVDAGALSNLDWKSEDAMPSAFRADFRIIYSSDKFPYALELVRESLDTGIKARIKQALAHAHKDRPGRAALRAYGRTARFDEPPAKVTRSIAELRDIRKSVQDTLR